MLNLQQTSKLHQVLKTTALAIALGIVSCTPQDPDANPASSNLSTDSNQNRPQVVVTSTVLCDLTRQIAEETVTLNCLMPPDQDPHVYAATPSDRKALEDANLILYGGYSYEPSLIKIIQATNTEAPKIAVYEAAVPDPLMSEEHHHEDEHGAEESHPTVNEPEATGTAAADHAETELVADPHIWHDATQGAQMAEVIQKNLSKLTPANAERYQQNAEALSMELNQLHGWIKTQVATVPEADRKLVTTHEALGYYAKAYGFDLEGAIEGLSTEEKPSASRVTELVDQVKQTGVPAIFVETTANPKLIEAVAKDAGVKVAEQPLFIEGPGGAETAAPSYQAMLVTNTCTIVNALGGQCDAASAPVASSKSSQS